MCVAGVVGAEKDAGPVNTKDAAAVAEKEEDGDVEEEKWVGAPGGGMSKWEGGGEMGRPLESECAARRGVRPVVARAGGRGDVGMLASGTM